MTARMDRLVFTLSDVTNARGEYVADWRWRLVAAENGKTLAWSEGYRRRIDAVRNAARTLAVPELDIAEAVQVAAREKRAALAAVRRTGVALTVEVVR